MVFSITPVIPPVIPQVINNPVEQSKTIPPVITTKYKGYAREPNEIISPWFEDGVFAGVRVKTDGEEFVIDKKDYLDGKPMSWGNAMFSLNDDNLTTWNRHQLSIVILHYDEINKVLVDFGKDKLKESYWTCEESPFERYRAYFGHCEYYAKYITDSSKWLTDHVRAIKDLKNS